MIHALVSGTLIADPAQRVGQRGGAYATATVRSGAGDNAVFVSVIAFRDEAVARLLELHRGDGISIAGRAELSQWTGRDGAERHGLSIVVDEISAARPRPRSDIDSRAPRRRNPYPRRQHGNGPAGDARQFDDEIAV